MSKFRKIVENVLSTSLKEYRTFDAYEDWFDKILEDMDKKYAIYVETTDKYGKEYAFKDMDGNWNTCNYFEDIDPTYKTIMYWDTPKEAEKAMAEYKIIFPEKNPQVVEIYSEDKNDYHDRDYWEEKYNYDEYEDDLYNQEADARYEQHKYDNLDF